MLTWWSSATFIVLWITLFVMLAADRDGLEHTNNWFDDRPLAVRVVLWVLLLPIVIGLKAWSSSSTSIRTVALVGLVLWTVASAVSLARLLTE